MSDKEERILIWTGKNGDELCDRIRGFDCPYGRPACDETCPLGITRSEAVERMAKAMREYADFPVSGYNQIASVALDALLGGGMK